MLLDKIFSGKARSRTSQSPRGNTEPGYCKYEYVIDSSRETAAAHVVQMVGQRKRVLDLGCGPGSITKVLAQEAQCRVTALDQDLESINVVRPYCESVFQADFNSMEWSSQIEGKGLFDVVIATDVLEHLCDPWTTLKQMVPFINSGGYLVISLPHACHVGLISCLINGDFAYGDKGLLDRTHFRFFGIKNIEALVTQANLKIVEARYAVVHPEDTEFADTWYDLSETLKSELSRSFHAEVYQVVVKAVPIDYPGEAIPLELLGKPQSAPLTGFALLRKRIGSLFRPRSRRRIAKILRHLGIEL